MGGARRQERKREERKEETRQKLGNRQRQADDTRNEEEKEDRIKGSVRQYFTEKLKLKDMDADKNPIKCQKHRLCSHQI